MERVGLARRLYDNYPSQLSGGQRQRVAIARALINQPRLVICDEPTSALDVSVQSQILNLLQDLRRDMGLTYLLISHNLAVVEHMATRVAVMYLGRIVEEAETDALFRAPKHPYSQALLQSVLTPEPGLGVPDTQLGAAYPDPLAIPPGCRFHPRCARVMPRCRSEAPQPIALPGGIVECHLYDAQSDSEDLRMTAAQSQGSRSGAIARARAYVESGAFERDLARRVAHKTESQKLPASLPELHRYLDEEMVPAFAAHGLCHAASTTIRSPGQGPVLLATRIEDAALPTVLGYGHGDVIRGLEDQWTKGKGPWVTARDGERLYGRGTADNKGQHTINMAALEAVMAERGGRLGFNAQVHHRDGRGGGLQGARRAGRRQQGGLRGRRAGRLRRPAREAGAADHDARLPRRHQLRPRLRPARGRASLRQLGRADRQSGRDPRQCAGQHRRAGGRAAGRRR